jgi:hypothetical protein
LTHIAQYELAQGKLAGDLWLIEGFADWAAYRVLEALGLDTFNRRKHQKIAQVRRASEPPQLSLAQMVTAQDWDALSARYGSAIPYAQAFLATDLLIEQHGVASVVEYFRCMSHSSTRLENFQAAFGDELLAFEHKFIAHQGRLHDGSLPDTAAQAPLPD